MKVIGSLKESLHRTDNTPLEKLELNRVRSTIEGLCDKYLPTSSDILEFEALPSAIDATLSVLESSEFLELFSFEQTSDTLFLIKRRRLDLL